MIKLQKSTFLNEEQTKEELCKFITEAKFLSMGEECRKFEENFSIKQKRKYSVYVNSGSSANLILIQSLINRRLLKTGDEVGVSSLTWATNVMPLIQLGLKPVLVDTKVETLNISSELLNQVISSKDLKAVFITNALGLSGDMDEIKSLCEKNNILLIEDNCESLGSSYNGRLLGNFGLASTFSFFVGHHISTIEGGMICTDDEELYNSIIMARAHGWDRNLKKEKQNELRNEFKINDFYSKYAFYELGFNVRPSEINGFIGNLQIKYWDFLVSERENNFKYLHECIKSNPDLINLEFEKMDIISSFAIPVIVKDSSKRDHYISRFIEAEVEIRPLIAGNIGKQPFYKKYVGEDNSCPRADFLHENSFYFGNYPELANDEVQLLGKLLRQ